jgi:hypothetical protein
MSGLTHRLLSPAEDHLLPGEYNYGLVWTSSPLTETSLSRRADPSYPSQTNLCGRPTSEVSSTYSPWPPAHDSISLSPHDMESTGPH